MNDDVRNQIKSVGVDKDTSKVHKSVMEIVKHLEPSSTRFVFLTLQETGLGPGGEAQLHLVQSTNMDPMQLTQVGRFMPEMRTLELEGTEQWTPGDDE